MKKLIIAEKVFTVLSIILFTQGIVQLVFELRTGRSYANSQEGNLDVMVAFFIVYTIAFFLVFLRWRRVVDALPKRKLLLLLEGIAVASVFWSASPGVTIRRTGALIGTTIFGVYLATRYSLEEQFRLLLWALGTAMVLSLLCGLCFPTIGIHQSGVAAGLWRGIYTHKNSLGGNMGYALLAFSLHALWGNKYRWVGWVGSGLAFTLLLLSGSATPLLAYLTVMALLPLYSILRWRYALTLFFFMMALMFNAFVSTFALSNLEPILGAFGRDITLTGRTQLWSVVVEAIQKRPWLGHGYSAFWLGWDSPAAQVWTAIGWQPEYSHNGYLELALELGLLGIFVFGIDYLLNFLRAIIFAAATNNAAGIFPLAFLTYFLPLNITDSSVMRQNSLVWLLYISLTFSIHIQSIKVKHGEGIINI